MLNFWKTVLISLSWLALCNAAAAQDFDLQATLDQARTENGIVGMGAIIMRSDGTYTLAVSGERIKGQGDPVQAGDAWHIGSNTKSITALLYARLVEMDLASWGATVPDLFPDDRDSIDPAWDTITIEDLFAHRSGVAQLGGAWLIARQTDRRPVDAQRRLTALDFISRPPAKAVGAFDYNNLGYIIAGAAIETILSKAAGRNVSWEEALQTYIFSESDSEGIGMGWGFGPPQAGLEGHRGALGTSFFVSGVGKGKNADNPAALGPAGTLHASLLAHARLGREYLLSDSALISETVRLKLWTAHPPGDPEADYAMGWGIRKSDTYGTYFSHSGSNTMWLSDIRIVPDHDMVVIVNSNQFGDKALKAHQSVLSAIFEHYSAAVTGD